MLTLKMNHMKKGIIIIVKIHLHHMMMLHLLKRIKKINHLIKRIRQNNHRINKINQINNKHNMITKIFRLMIKKKNVHKNI